MLQFKDEIKQLFNTNANYGLIKIIALCDPGADDALMLLQILNCSFYKVEAIIPVEGNTSYKETLQNTLNICEHIKRFDIDIYPCTDYLEQSTIKKNVSCIYGDNALNGLILPKAKIAIPKNISGMHFICEALIKNRYILISTGPLTELARILTWLLHNNINGIKNIMAISMMGGVINPIQEANWPVLGLRHSEANFSYDIPATQTVFELCQQYDVPIFLVPLDLSQSILACKSDINLQNLSDQPITKLAKSLIENIPSHYQSRYGLGPNYEHRQPLHDIHASNCLINPNHYYGKWTNINISKQGQSIYLNINESNDGNVFLLDIHYCHRQQFFNDLSNSF